MEQATPTVADRQTLTDWILLASGLAVILAVVILSPGGLLDKADSIGYAVCHQIPERSFFIAGRQLPLCARCTGQYLGALAGLAVLLMLGRRQAGRLPTPGIFLVLLGFLALWAFDGFNSYLTLIPGAPHLYEPHHALRLATGGLQGVALIVLAWPFFVSTLRADVTQEQSLSRLREVGYLLLAVALIFVLVESEVPALLYPLALLSTAGTLLMLTLANSMAVALILRRDGRARSWRQALPVLAGGLALALVEIVLIGLFRSWLTSLLGLPF